MAHTAPRRAVDAFCAVIPKNFKSRGADATLGAFAGVENSVQPIVADSADVGGGREAVAQGAAKPPRCRQRRPVSFLLAHRCSGRCPSTSLQSRRALHSRASTLPQRPSSMPAAARAALVRGRRESAARTIATTLAYDEYRCAHGQAVQLASRRPADSSRSTGASRHRHDARRTSRRYAALPTCVRLDIKVKGLILLDRSPTMKRNP
jgi:hypothetical protein